MEAVIEHQPLIENLVQLVTALWNILVLLLSLAVPWIPLAAWIVFWLFAVDWVKLRKALLAGGWIGLLLVGLVMILVWGIVAPPAGGTHSVLGLTLSNFVAKTVYVTTLFCIMLLCGSVQLSGCCADCCRFEDEPAEATVHNAAH